MNQYTRFITVSLIFRLYVTTAITIIEEELNLRGKPS